MKITELVHVIEELGLEPDFDYVFDYISDDDGDEEEVLVVYNDGQSVAVVYVDWIGLWFCDESHFNKLESHKQHRLLEAIKDYSYTPFDDRKDKKYFCLKHKWLGRDEPHYLYRDETTKEYFLSKGIDDSFYHLESVFSEEDLKEIKSKFNTTLADFEIIETK